MDIKLKFNDIYDSINIAELIDSDNLKMIADKVIQEFKDDQNSRAEWLATYNTIMTTANQKGELNLEIDGADVKLPIMTTACMQYAARSYPEFIRNGRVVSTLIMGRDDQQIKKQKSVRVSEHMNYQLLVEDSEWEKSFDSMLQVLPLVGLTYKKVFYDTINLRNKSEFCRPDQIVINNEVQDLLSARRITHIIPTHYNTILESINYGLFLDVKDKLKATSNTASMEKSYDKPLILLEQVTYLDLDADGYEEPYVVTVEQESGCVLRIYRCFDMDNVETDENLKIKRIKRTEYYVDYHFIPSPDGTFHSIGFGQLLLPLNHAINTVINELIDAGSLANLPGGFVSKDFRSNKKRLVFKKGEWQQLEMRGEDIAKSIFKMPVGEPSQTLFQLLGLLIEQARQLASVTDMLQGNQAGQNMPATTSVTLVEQGLKVFNSLQKRTHRSLKQELRLLFRLNSLYLDQDTYYVINDDVKAIAKEDYDIKSLDIIPVSDPSMSSDIQRISRAKAILELMPQLQGSGREEAVRNYLDALNTPLSQVEALLPKPDPNAPPPPEIQKIQAETITEQMKPHKDQAELEIKRKEAEAKETDSKARLILAEAELVRAKSQAELYEAQAIAALADIDDTRKIKILDTMINSMNKGEGSLSMKTLNKLLESVNLDVSLAEDEQNEEPSTSDTGGMGTMGAEQSDPMAVSPDQGITGTELPPGSDGIS